MSVSRDEDIACWLFWEAEEDKFRTIVIPLLRLLSDLNDDELLPEYQRLLDTFQIAQTILDHPRRVRDTRHFCRLMASASLQMHNIIQVFDADDDDE